ncbi:chromosome partitioning protein ParB [Sphingorhabdus lutea]|uniref:Chromosome partitioning protein ParB n=1 Tax=Sphingorhabdus lutea TaxID=1913578 RepID=A0A1L3J9E3_9SPHN|nr:ParB/RepB/Spo0J family partition protein [Sphingorhabdus lutea]APG61762.1 chromosome partitioning protein ParB [Sphingorhabdus lutea]
MSETKPIIKKKGLGRGLDSLLGEAIRGNNNSNSQQDNNIDSGEGDSRISIISVADIQPHPGQPRRHFAEGPLNELAASIAKHGILQPIVVRPRGKGYQIIAGERRWRAAQRARLHEVPAIIRSFSDSEALEIALIENIQREDLNPIEEAEAYHRLIEEFGHSAAELGKLVDKSRSHIANMIRLLDLPKSVRDLVVEDRLTMGHARALINAEDSLSLAVQIMKQGLSVRQTEALVRKEKRGDDIKDNHAAALSKDKGKIDSDLLAVEDHLSDILGLKVKIVKGDSPDQGSVTFHYNSLDQLDMLCMRVTGEQI